MWSTSCSIQLERQDAAFFPSVREYARLVRRKPRQAARRRARCHRAAPRPDEPRGRDSVIAGRRHGTSPSSPIRSPTAFAVRMAVLFWLLGAAPPLPPDRRTPQLSTARVFRYLVGVILAVVILLAIAAAVRSACPKSHFLPPAVVYAKADGESDTRAICTAKYYDITGNPFDVGGKQWFLEVQASAPRPPAPKASRARDAVAGSTYGVYAPPGRRQAASTTKVPSGMIDVNRTPDKYINKQDIPTASPSPCRVSGTRRPIPTSTASTRRGEAATSARAATPSAAGFIWIFDRHFRRRLLDSCCSSSGSDNTERSLGI